MAETRPKLPDRWMSKLLAAALVNVMVAFEYALGVWLLFYALGRPW